MSPRSTSSARPFPRAPDAVARCRTRFDWHGCAREPYYPPPRSPYGNTRAGVNPQPAIRAIRTGNMGNPEQGSTSASQQVNDLFDALDITEAINSHEFRLFLDHLPIAVVISKIIGGDQRIIFANNSYEALTGQAASEIKGRGWSVLESFTLE